MKILIPIGSFFPAQVGGPSSTLFWLAKELKKIGYEPSVVTTMKGVSDLPCNTKIELEGVQVIYYSYRFWQLPFRLLGSLFREVPRADILILSSFFYLPSMFCVILAKLFKKPVIISPRGEFSYSALEYKSFSKVLRIKFSKLLYPNNITFHATSNQEVEDIRNVFQHVKVSKIPNFMILPPKVDSNVGDYFLFLGRIHSIKSIDNIIEALDFETFKNSKFEFRIAGFEAENGYLDRIRKLTVDRGLQAKVKFLGPVNGDEKNKLLANAKFLFLVSKSENFGNVVIESLAQGTPVVASFGTPWELLKEYDAGFWIDNQPSSIMQTVSKILHMESNDYLRMRVNAEKLVKEKFDIKSNIWIWDNLLKATIRNYNETNHTRP
ncbi:glycosyltransferase [Arthrospiribacter ruber]|uniref:Glycosyltransferase n=1 Tax=Arthrospiribacter ruber TaxID=2487934 RepID=A0A951IUP5_9BACT|nr:glycosyltransferase [Arthrospiribacter ruber]MBW3466411.1 glycosyltransferase [Arthrospiribacter ruber]